MQELQFIDRGTLEWRETDEPRLRHSGDALVRPLAVAICDLDRMIVRGAAPARGPFPFGHECVAEVVEVGDEVCGFAPGDRVIVPFQISCGSCSACRRGRTGHCATVPRMSMYGLGPLSGAEWGGFLSDLVRVPYADHMLFRLPEGVDPVAVASASDNLVDAWRTVAPHLRDEPAGSVLVVGSNAAIGLYAVAIARALGATVDWVGGSDRQRGAAERLGARVLDPAFPERLGPYPITVDASNHPDGLGCAIRSTGPDGVCTSIGIYFTAQELPLLEMYSKGIHFYTGRVHARPAIPDVLDLVVAKKLRPETVTGAVVDWDDAAEAITEHSTKLVITRR
ncbi:zinc-dependent alcohol dehydrogenase [Nocardia iowensis]|uniref:zinc-dependent alcohol dehydrogenase n=1 Tax=Nocardia iowensis TaxID=204891 RepID=UPI001FE59270|nr:alcohol dehydrogenase catalytic domain-containing protein [Nocardia iowensis]